MITRKKIILLTLFLAMQLTGVYAIKILHGPYLQNVSETEATIVWVTDVPSLGWVETAPDDGNNFYACARPRFYDTKIGVKQEALIHTVKLTGLQPGTRYRYRVNAQEVIKHVGNHVYYGRMTGNDVWSKAAPAFTTLNTQKPNASFVIVNDIHENSSKLATLLEKSRCKEKDIMFFNGDMLSLFDDAERKFFKGFMDTAVHICAQTVPLYYVRGNHETRGNKAPTFQDYVCPRVPNLYFTVQHGPIFFVCLDTGEDKPDTDIEYYGITDYDNYRSEQATWLKQVIASDAFKQARYRVVVCHVPPRTGATAWHGDLEVQRKFVSILNEANIDLMICGHLHAFSYREPDNSAKFPILINSHEAAVIADANAERLQVEVMETDGKISFTKTLK